MDAPVLLEEGVNAQCLALAKLANQPFTVAPNAPTSMAFPGTFAKVLIVEAWEISLIR